MNYRLFYILILVVSLTQYLFIYSNDNILLDSILVNYREIDGFQSKPKFRAVKIINTAERQHDTTVIDEIMVFLYDSVKVIESRELDIIYDKSFVIIVNHFDKSILMRENRYNINNSFISSIFNIKEWENKLLFKIDKSNNNISFTFESNQRFQLPYKKNKMIITIDSESNLINEIEQTAFSMGNDVRFRQKMTYLYNDSIKNEFKNALSFILNSNEQLNTKYINYRIISK